MSIHEDFSPLEDYRLLFTVFLVLLVVVVVIWKTIGAKTGKLSGGGSVAKGKNEKLPAFVLVGPSNGGKSSLFSLLTVDKVRSCVTSQETAVFGHFNGRNTNLIDFPGHFKLRYKALDFLQNNDHLKGVIFVVDSTVDPRELTKTAEFLVDVLNITEGKDLVVPVDVLIACNKNESFTARPPLKIKDALEKEICSILARKKKSLGEVKKSLGSSGNGDHDSDADEDDELALLSNISDPSQFKFSGLEGNVVAIPGSVSQNKISKWVEWIEDHE